MGIGVLGPLTIDGSSARLAHRDRVVLSALVVAGDEALSLDQLAEAVWGDGLPASSRKVLQGCVNRLRRALGPAAIVTVPNGYRLAVSADDVDARRFERLLRRAGELLALGDADRALFALGEASALWRGRALPDLEGWEPGRIAAQRLDEMRLDAEELRLEAALRAGRHLEVLAEASARVAEAPLRERRWALAALARYQAGRQAEALATLRHARAVFRTELGLEPGPDLVAMETAILRQDPSLATAQRLPEPSSGCPYRGLVPYDVADAEEFFGRDADVAACLRRLETAGVLVVVGPSGSGKSSVVRAGVVAALRRDGRAAVIVTPGRHPAETLESIPSAGRRQVLVVDQCEEAFTQCEDTSEQARFLSALGDRVDAAERNPLVVVVRADRLGDLSAELRLARAVERGLYLLGPMREPDLRAAVDGPAGQAGLLVEAGLTDLVVRDAEGEPGALPLLSHALRQTWQRREGRTLTVAAYRATGGIRAAVARTAEELYDGLAAGQRPMLRRLLLRLVVPAADGEPSRTRVARRSAAADPEQERMIERLVAARLVTADEGYVELAHEALARAWPRLRSWLEEDADGLRIHRHLTVTADAWDGVGRPDSELYRGARLARALEWRERTRPDLTRAEEAFLDAARGVAAADEMRVAERARQQARINRRLRTLLAVTVVLLLLAGGAGVVAVRQARLATSAATAADARRIGAQALVTAEIDKALLLAVQSVALDDSNETRGALLAALSRFPRLARVVRTPGRVPRRLGVSGDGRRLVVLDGRHLGSFDLASLRGTWTTDDPHVANPEGVSAIRADGGQAAIVTGYKADWVVRMIGEVGDKRTRALPTLADPSVIDYRPDGHVVAVGYGGAMVAGDVRGPHGVQIWNLETNARAPEHLVTPRPPRTVRFSPDGRLLYAGASRGLPARPYVEAVDVIDLAESRVVRHLELPGPVLDISPDGLRLAVADARRGDGPGGGAEVRLGDVVLVDATNGTERSRLPGDDVGPVTRIRFGVDGRSLSVVTASNSVVVWALDTGRRLQELRGHAGAVLDAVSDRAGTTVYTSGEEGTILVWDTRGDRSFARNPVTTAATGPTGSRIAISPDGRWAALNRAETDADGQLHTLLSVADMATGRAGPWVDTGDKQINGLAWRPDGRQLATTGSEGLVRTWEPDGLVAKTVAKTVLGSRYAADVAYMRDGKRLLVADTRLLQLDAVSLRSLADPIQLPHRASRMAVAPDERTVLIVPAEDGGVVSVVKLADGHSRDIRLTFTAADAAFSSTGRYVAVGGGGGGVQVVDLITGAPVGPALVGHTGPVGPLAFSGDGTTVVSGGRDGRVAVWSGHGGGLLGTIGPLLPGVGTFPAFRHDGHTVMVVATDGTVQTWDTDPRSWVAFACHVAGRALTEQEWAESVGDRPYRPVCAG